jgi:hypothetical protein
MTEPQDNEQVFDAAKRPVLRVAGISQLVEIDQAAIVHLL